MSEHNRNGGGETIEIWWCDGKLTTISSPGFSVKPWLGLVMCLPESVRLQMDDFGGGTDMCEIRLAVKHTVHWHFQEKFNILGFSLQYGSTINENKLLSPFQCGFRSNYSTELATTAFSDFIRRRMDQSLLTGAVFIELRKAFDSVDHDLLNRMDLRTVN